MSYFELSDVCFFGISPQLRPTLVYTFPVSYASLFMRNKIASMTQTLTPLLKLCIVQVHTSICLRVGVRFSEEEPCQEGVRQISK
uniref:Ovule protein n=1 Tax=Heterorhabditis bacteriophora TaxID=37862 RepID=A0A1I7WT80_HETBA